VVDPAITGLLERLRAPDPVSAWEEFLDQYSPVLFQAARHCSTDNEAAADCYLHICEQLALHGFRRLLKFKLEGPASFKTWLQVVARNLCIDWHRKRSGRPRPFKSVQSLSELEFQIYVCRFERGLTSEATLEHLRPVSPDLDLAQVEGAERRIEDCLSSRQRWILSMHQNRSPDTTTVLLSEEAEEFVSQIPDFRIDQETLIVNLQQHAQMMKYVAGLPKHERLLLQLRFEEDLSLQEIAQLTRQADAQRVHRQIAAILKKLRNAME
jgi:RNA polymerase sigma factor (sigma-70 family)